MGDGSSHKSKKQSAEKNGESTGNIDGVVGRWMKVLMGTSGIMT